MTFFNGNRQRHRKERPLLEERICTPDLIVLHNGFGTQKNADFR